MTYWLAKRLDKSVPLLEDVFKREEAKLGRQHSETLLTMGDLGVNYKDAGRFKDAIPLLMDVREASKQNLLLRGYPSH